MNIKLGKRTLVLGTAATVVAVLAGVALFGAIGIKGWSTPTATSSAP